MKEHVKNIYSQLLDKAGILDRQLNQIEESIWLIPMYHRIVADALVEDPLDMGMCVSEENFLRQIEYFKQNFDIASVSEVIALIESNTKLPKRVASITFDDGYLDNLTRAAPVLKANGIRGTLFIATNFIGSEKGFWWDEIISAFTHSDVGKCVEVTAENGESLVVTINAENRQNQAQQVLDFLWKQNPSKITRIVADIILQLKPESETLSPVMNREQIEQAYREAFDLGAHTESHPNLNLITEAQVEQELCNSRDKLRSYGGNDIDGFAMPAGFTPNYLQDMLRKNQFKYAMSTVRGLNRNPDTYMLKRIGMPNKSVSRIKRAIGSL